MATHAELIRDDWLKAKQKEAIANRDLSSIVNEQKIINQDQIYRKNQAIQLIGGVRIGKGHKAKKREELPPHLFPKEVKNAIESVKMSQISHGTPIGLGGLRQILETKRSKDAWKASKILYKEPTGARGATPRDRAMELERGVPFGKLDESRVT